ncbi:hypothetical protein [Trinickia fusca]|uniref:Uncharacterized protein n=1 Tax=Trinickia fusca TaxID=2419777 RepID=A0A494XIP4_9BURK|nr:hypothetical protein [Trinickia fusca]RKP50530.1 hypothetical protein D7S89_05335 [Trinickia fusca]
MSSVQSLTAAATSQQLDAYSRVPSQLRARQLIIALLSLLVAFIGWLAYRQYESVVQTIGRDSEPSIVAAENIRSTLGDAHTDFVNAFVTGEGASGDSIRHYRKAITSANDFLVSASQNITYGDDERRPILSVLNNLSEYQTLVGGALAGSGNLDDVRAADAVMRERINPAVEALADANFDHLHEAYNHGRKIARIWGMTFLAVAFVLLLVLIDTQRFLARRFRRVINPFIAGGTAVFVISVIGFGSLASGVLSNIRVAKEDAFDSVYALSKAQALAYAANAQESLYLLMHDKASEQALQATLFQSTTDKLFPFGIKDKSPLPADLNQLKGHGLLGDELANITFDGEETAARATVAAWLDYMRIDGKIRELESSGHHKEAVALCLGTQPMESDWAFERFTHALKATSDINQIQFEAAVDRAFGNARLLGFLLLPILIAPLLGSILGLAQRLAEFRE